VFQKAVRFKYATQQSVTFVLGSSDDPVPTVETTDLSIYLGMDLHVQPFVGPWSLFSSLKFYTVGRTSWTGDQPVARPLPTQDNTNTD
jgi:hypothetical protein